MAEPMHLPVLLKEIEQAARDLARAPATYWDATFGRGGHCRALLEAFPELRVFASDRDRAAIQHGETEFSREIASGRLVLAQGDYREFLSSRREELVSFHQGRGFDLILADLGVSSPQLDQAERGFSFYQDGPLDMRMDQSRGETAADIVNRWSERDLLQLFQNYGEIRSPQRVVRAILQDRKTKAFARTMELSGLIERIEGWRRKGWHPATLYFLALRLEVNQELAGLKEAVRGFAESLAESGRLMIITFHSLEDRIVKYTLKESGDLGFAVNKKVIQADREEQVRNPRSRSAKLRVFERGSRVRREGS